MTATTPAEGPRVEIIGIDHIYLAVRELPRAAAFYDRLMPALGFADGIEARAARQGRRGCGFRKNEFVLGGERHVQYFNRHFGLVLRPARDGTATHDPYAPGLHHLCLRVDRREDVDAAAAGLRALGIEADAARLYPEYAPDYYAVFFQDPDGIQLEITNDRQGWRKVGQCRSNCRLPRRAAPAIRALGR